MFRTKKPNRQSDSDGLAAEFDSFAEMDFEAAEGAEHPRSPREAIEPEKVPLPADDMKARRNPFIAVLNGLFSIVVFVVLVAVGGYAFIAMQLDNPGPLETAKTVVVPKGSGVSAIAARLEREGVVSDANIFIAGALLSKATAKLQAGEFVFEPQASINQVIDALVDGRAILHKITVPEGLTSEQIVERLRADEVLVGEIATIPDEGTLLPDTYKFTRGTARQDIINRMASEHDRALARVWERRAGDLPLQTPDELVILASIVEKETGKADERPRVASVFINRLNRNMRLQSDPTIIYGLVGGKGSLGRGILRSEIEQETAYNTYRINGLPPTPIANPGIAALEATANPSRTEDIYFVADGTGGHVFAASLEEHNRNVARWRKYQNQVKLEQEAAAAAIQPAAAPADAAEGSAATPVMITPRGVIAEAGSGSAAAADANGTTETTGTADRVPLPTLRPERATGG